MGIMQNKVTRRVALGTIAGGLATGVVLLRYLRGPKFSEARIAPYGEIDVSPSKITSALSPSEVQKAFRVLQNEREMWLKFRGVAGKIEIINKTVPLGKQEPKVLTNKGYVSLSLDIANTMRWTREVAPANVKMIYSDRQNSDPVWTLKIADSTRKGGEIFVGRDIESIQHGNLFAFLTAPLTPMLSLSNGVVKLLPGLWKVSRESGSGHSEYLFQSDGKIISNELIPTVAFADGHLVKLIPSRRVNKPYPIFSFKDHVDKNGFSYPTKIILSFGDHGEFAQKHDSIEVTLSDITITSV